MLSDQFHVTITLSNSSARSGLIRDGLWNGLPNSLTGLFNTVYSCLSEVTPETPKADYRNTMEMRKPRLYPEPHA